MMSGGLNITQLLTNGRTRWLTVISLFQGPVRGEHRQRCNCPMNAEVVIFSKSMIVPVVKDEQFVPTIPHPHFAGAEDQKPPHDR